MSHSDGDLIEAAGRLIVNLLFSMPTAIRFYDHSNPSALRLETLHSIGIVVFSRPKANTLTCIVSFR